MCTTFCTTFFCTDLMNKWLEKAQKGFWSPSKDIYLVRSLIPSHVTHGDQIRVSDHLKKKKEEFIYATLGVSFVTTSKTTKAFFFKWIPNFVMNTLP